MKKIVALLLVLVMAFALIACQNAEKPAENNKPAENKPAQNNTPAEPVVEESKLGKEPVEIVFWHCASDDAGVLMDKYVADFNANNEYQITVKPIYQGQYADATTLLKTMLSGGNYKELPDVMQMDATGKVDYFNSGKAFTVDDAIAAFNDSEVISQYLTGALGNWQFSGAQLGMPFATSTTITFANMDLLKQAGWDKVPDTFADVVKLYSDMQAKGMTQKVFQSVPNTPSLANWLGQLGSYVVNMSNGADGMATELDCIDNGALATFLTEWKAMYDAGALLNENSSSDLFIGGNVVLMTNSSSNIATNIAKVNGAFEVATSPLLRVNSDASYGATVSGSMLTMFDSEDALKKEAAWVFVKYLTGADIQADFGANTGYIPACSAAMESDAYKAVLATYPQMSVPFDQLTNTPADMRSVTVGPSKDFYYAIMQGSSDMLANGMSVEETVEIMAESMQTLLDDYAMSNG